MPRTRIRVSISFPTEKDRDDAMRKSARRGRSLSKQIQWYFDNLPEMNGTKSSVEKAMAIFQDAIGDGEES